MASTWPLQQKSRRTFDSVIATIRRSAHALAAEHALALRAATKAASPRKCQAEVRAMYLPPLDPHQEGAGHPARGYEANSRDLSRRIFARHVPRAGAP